MPQKGKIIMSIYSNNKKLVRDYIKGNDLDVDLEILENDLDFMKAVIDVSNDEKLYGLCSEDIKYNYEMIKFLINKFHDNLDFIIKVVMDFLDNYDHINWYKDYNEDYFLEAQESIGELEVLIAIDEYLQKRVLDENTIAIKFRLKEKYTKFRIIVELAASSTNENKLKDTLDKGFSLVEILFPASYPIKDYYAKSIIDEILMSSEGNTYEDKIHKLWNSLEKPVSALKTLIKIVKKYDFELANYIIARPEPFTKYIQEIDSIINNWDNYNKKIIDERILDILDVINDYYYKYGHLLCTEEFECVKHYAELLNLEERFQALDPASYECASIPFPSKGKTYQDKKMFHDLTPVIQSIIQGGNEYSISKSNKQEANTNKISTFRPKR